MGFLLTADFYMAEEFFTNSRFLKNFLYLCNGLWLLPLSRTYLIGYFFDDSSELKNLAVLFTRRTATKCPVRLYIPTTDWLGMCDIFPAWAFVLLIRVKGSQGLEFGISKYSACAFLWTYPEIRTCSIDD